MQKNLTKIGKITRIKDNLVDCIINRELASFAPIVNGMPREIGRVGTLVKIPIGKRRLYGVILGINISKDSDKIEIKTLSVELIGEFIPGKGFSWTIGQYPGIEDAVHILDDEDLKILYPENKDESIFLIGENLKTGTLGKGQIKLNNLILHHTMISGMTGSGKSNFVAELITKLGVEYPNSQIFIFDPRGEYNIEKLEYLKNLDPAGVKETRFQIPHYYLSEETIGNYFFEDYGTNVLTLIRREKKKWKERYKIKDNAPIPYDLRNIWYGLACLNKMTVPMSQDTYKTLNECLDNFEENMIDHGDPSLLKEPEYHEYSLREHKKGSKYFGTQANQISYFRNQLNRGDLRAIYNITDYGENYKKGDTWEEPREIFKRWFDKPVTVINFQEKSKNLRNNTIDAFLEIINRQIEEKILFSGTFLPRPLFIIIEEAHEILSNRSVLKKVQKLIKQARKHALGFCFITQNPAKISSEILSQIGTHFVFRLADPDNREIVRRLLPPNHRNLVPTISALPTGECVVLGDAVEFPIHLRIRHVLEKKVGSDPNVAKIWKQDRENLF